MKIEVIYATENIQYIIPVDVPEKCTLYQAIIDSNILNICVDINLDKQKTGIFGVISDLNTILKPNDRVEIYRPIPIDPITKRFERVKNERKKHVKKYHKK